MLKLSVRLTVLLGSLVAAAAADAAIVGPHADGCEGTGKIAMLVKISGIKSRDGTIRVQSYGGDPAMWFEKGTYLERVDVAPSGQTMEVCMPVPKAGTYAVSVRHSRGGSFSMTDGAGFSGNPNMSVMDAMFKRKPPTAEVEVHVNGIAHVAVTMKYVQNGELKPIALSSVPVAE